MSTPSAQQPPATTFASINVLIVDDSPANREAFDSVVTPLGYSVFLAESGRRALEFADHRPFSVILLDVRMPVLNGLETAVELRKKPFTRTTPIVFVSAYEGTQVQVSRAGLGGFIDFVFSPVNPEILTWKVQTWVQLGIRQEMLRRQAARISEEHEALHKLLAAIPALEPKAREEQTRLASAIKAFVQILSEHQGISS